MTSDSNNTSVVKLFSKKTSNDSCNVIIQVCCIRCHICNDTAQSCDFASKTQLSSAYEYSSQYVAAMALDASAYYTGLCLKKDKTSEFNRLYCNKTHHTTAFKHIFSKEKHVLCLYLMQHVENMRASNDLNHDDTMTYSDHCSTSNTLI